MEKRRGMSKVGQTTIFIIIAILIVAAILVFVLYVQPTFLKKVGVGLNFEGCVEEAVKEKIKEIVVQGGFVEPELYYMYGGDKLGYLCYINSFYEPCVVQKPFLKQHFESELKKAIRSEVDACYDVSVSELKGSGYDVVAGEVNFEISLWPKQVRVVINAPTSVSRETGQFFREFRVDVQNPIYDLLMIATSILQFETKYGDSDVTTLMVFYPDFVIDKIKRDDGTTVYLMEDKSSKTKFNFASRSYAWPAGYGYGEEF